MGRRWDVAEEAAWAQWGRDHMRTIVRLYWLRRGWPLILVLAGGVVAVAAARALPDLDLPAARPLLRWGALGCGLALAAYIGLNLLWLRPGGGRPILPVVLTVAGLLMLAVSFVV